jgi:hypothetical protein
MLKKRKSISAFAVVVALLLSISAPAFSAPPVRVSCALGGSCAVGDIGPGGGTVYYFNRKGFNCGPSYISTGSPTGGLCHYLEVAPNTWSGGSDPEKVWAVWDLQYSSVSGITDESSANNSTSGIGLGYKNSDLIVAQGNDATTAAGAARAYTSTVLGVIYSDWYLPTTAELNLAYQWKTKSRVPVGGFLTLYGSSYWSSSVYRAVSPWAQSFLNGVQFYGYKADARYVRPVRAF